MFGRGYKPDPDAVKLRRRHFRMLAAQPGVTLADASTLPLSTSNRQFVSPTKGGSGILNQGQTGSCTGHATAAGITNRMAIAGKPIPLVSPIGVYTVGRDIMRGPSTGALPALTDDGAEPSAVILGVQTYGVCAATTWGNYPADPSTINDEPTTAQLQAADDFVLEGAYFLTEPSVSLAQSLSGLLQALASGFTTTTALPASGNAFENYSSGVLAPSALTGDIDHYNLFLDYAFGGTTAEWSSFLSGLQNGTVDTTLVEQLTLFDQNSWGQGWGWSDVSGLSGGFCQLRGDTLALMSDLAVLNVTSTGSES